MAIIILNRSICRICGNLIKEGDEIAGFPHFARSEQDPLYFFSDAGFHATCFVNHPLSAEALKAVAEYDKDVAEYRAKHIR